MTDEETAITRTEKTWWRAVMPGKHPKDLQMTHWPNWSQADGYDLEKATESRDHYYPDFVLQSQTVVTETYPWIDVESARTPVQRIRARLAELEPEERDHEVAMEMNGLRFALDALEGRI